MEVAGLVGLTPSGCACIMCRLMLLVRLSLFLEAALVRACLSLRAYGIERVFARHDREAQNAGIGTRPGSTWDVLTKPSRLELMQLLGLPA